MQETNISRKLKFSTVFLGTDLMQKEASFLILQAAKTNKKISAFSELDIWSVVEVKIPQTDPYFKIDSKKHILEIIKYLYQNNSPSSLFSKPILNIDRINLEKIENWLEKENPQIILALDPLARDIFVYLRKKLQKNFGIVALCHSFNSDRFWATEGGDLWFVPLPENREQLISEFVDPSKIIVYGPLIGKKVVPFVEKTVARKKMHWPSNGFLIGILADGLITGQVEELIERISAFPDLKINIIVFCSDPDIRKRIQDKSQSFLTDIFTVPFEEKNLSLSALDIFIFMHDKAYLPYVLTKPLAPIVIAKKNKIESKDKELDILLEKGLIFKANSVRDSLWQIEAVLKDRKIIAKKKEQLRLAINKFGIEKIFEEIFLRIKK